MSGDAEPGNGIPRDTILYDSMYVVRYSETEIKHSFLRFGNESNCEHKLIYCVLKIEAPPALARVVDLTTFRPVALEFF